MVTYNNDRGVYTWLYNNDRGVYVMVAHNNDRG